MSEDWCRGSPEIFAETQFALLTQQLAHISRLDRHDSCVSRIVIESSVFCSASKCGYEEAGLSGNIQE